MANCANSIFIKEITRITMITIYIYELNKKNNNDNNQNDLCEDRKILIIKWLLIIIFIKISL